MTSALSHVAIGVAVVAIFVTGGFAFHLKAKFLTNLSVSVALGIAAALLVTAARGFG